MAAASAEMPERQPSVTFRAECRGCGRMVRKHSRKALTWRCPHCQRVNPGPGLLEQMAQPPVEGTRRRRTRRAAAAETKATEQGPTSDNPQKSAPAPVRRKAKVTAAPPDQSGRTAQGDAQPGAAPAPTAPRPRSGFFDRLLYGEGDE